MLLYGLFLVLAGLLVSDTQEAVRAEKQKLQGVWIVTKAEAGGQSLPEDVLREIPSLGVVGDRLTSPGAEDGKDIWRGPLDLDVSGKVKRITVHVGKRQGRERTISAIYALEGDRLTICVNADTTSSEKPAELVTKQGSPFVLLTFRREGR